jgi:N-acetylmuramoyl-L-alanine amidase
MKIVIDCGHGGIDKNGKYTTAPSKQALVNGKMVHEGVLNRTIGGMLAHLLEWAGHEVIFTVHPNDSEDVSLSHRVRVANANTDALMVSVHCNAFNGLARGFEIYTSVGDTPSDPIAQRIYDSVNKIAPGYMLPMRKDISDGDSDKESDFYVLRHTKGSAVLIECFFFDNTIDYDLYQQEKFLTDMVTALYKGIVGI